jgi:hypothetical protein
MFGLDDCILSSIWIFNFNHPGEYNLRSRFPILYSKGTKIHVSVKELDRNMVITSSNNMDLLQCYWFVYIPSINRTIYDIRCGVGWVDDTSIRRDGWLLDTRSNTILTYLWFPSVWNWYVFGSVHPMAHEIACSEWLPYSFGPWPLEQLPFPKMD